MLKIAFKLDFSVNVNSLSHISNLFYKRLELKKKKKPKERNVPEFLLMLGKEGSFCSHTYQARLGGFNLCQAMTCRKKDRGHACEAAASLRPQHQRRPLTS